VHKNSICGVVLLGADYAVSGLVRRRAMLLRADARKLLVSPVASHHSQGRNSR
jgi:hypothetical protein